MHVTPLSCSIPLVQLPRDSISLPTTLHPLSNSFCPLPSPAFALPLLCTAVQLGRMDEFASGAAPLIEHSLAILEADSAAVTDPDLNPDVIKAMLRRRHIMGRGGRKGEDTPGERGRRSRKERGEAGRACNAEAAAHSGQGSTLALLPVHLPIL